MLINIISGTNREGSNTLKCAKQIEKILVDLKATTFLTDLRTLPKEIFSNNVYAEKPESFQVFSENILSADGLIVITPEYNGSMSGILKYFIDMLPFPESFQHKPVAFVGISAGQWGALRPVEHLQQIFGYRNAHIFPDRVFIPGGHKAFNEEGSMEDEALIERLNHQASAFLEFIKKIK